MSACEIIKKFGGQSVLANLIGRGQSTVAYWAKTDTVPTKWQSKLLELAALNGVELEPADFIISIKKLPATNKPNKISDLVAIIQPKPAANGQGILDLGIQKQVEIDGVGMGVLSDGTAFLTGRGLARLCGVVHSVVQDITTEWMADIAPPRVTKIRDILESHGTTVGEPYIAIKQRSTIFYAYPDTVCLAILEYYAFDAGSNVREDALKNYRLLAGKALREFIYTQVGYDPSNAIPDVWRQFHDRVSLTYNSVPQGYFGIFKEIADMIVTLGQAGLHISNKFVPDLSVGIHWAKHWKGNNLNARYGERIKFEHNFPEYFPQAESNPQEPWCYPDSALGEFRRWFRDDYIGNGKFQNYIEGKVKEQQLPVSFAQLAIAAYKQ